MKAWLKGGIWGVITLFVLTILFGLILMGLGYGWGPCGHPTLGVKTYSQCFVIPYLLLAWPVVLFIVATAEIFVGESVVLSSILAIIFGIALWFGLGALIGALVGWIAEKIKSRK